MKSAITIIVLLSASIAAAAQPARPTTRPADPLDPVAMQKEIAELRAEVARLQNEKEILSSTVHCLAGHGSDMAIAGLVALASTTRPVATFTSAREVISQHPMVRDAKRSPLSNSQLQILLVTSLGQKLRLTMHVSSVAPVRNTLDKDDSRDLTYACVKGVVDDNGMICQVNAWFPKEMQAELAKLPRGQIITLEGTIRSISYSPGPARSSMEVRLKDCLYGKALAAKLDI